MITCRCGKPFRFVGEAILNDIPVVGIECPDETCKKVNVISSERWLSSLRPHPKNQWPDVAGMV